MNDQSLYEEGYRDGWRGATSSKPDGVTLTLTAIALLTLGLLLGTTLSKPDTFTADNACVPARYATADMPACE